MELAFLTGALSGHFSVLAAHDADEATRLLRHFGPCRLAYLTLEADCASAIRLARDINHQTPVFALLHPPGPGTMNQAAANDCFDGVCLLPMPPEVLQAKTREALGLPRVAPDAGQPLWAALTREEVRFLTSRPISDPPVACRPSRGRRVFQIRSATHRDPRPKRPPVH
ncbi:hypothetical protein [Solidesulfovibrio sp.]